MLEFFRRLFDTTDFPSRWHCGSWTAGHGWLHILSDAAVWGAYVTIPCVLAYFAARRKYLPFRSIFLLFGAFILACGTTHLMEAVIFWWPAYRLAGAIKLATAVVSWATVIALVPVVPQALALRSPEELEREIAERKRAEAALLASLEEKQVLLKEIHHRVKNNLQVICSLLDIQSQCARDAADTSLFQESRDRVRSMALVHEALYQSESLARIDIGDYVRGLVGQLASTYAVTGRPADVRLNLDSVHLSIDEAVPCGLIVNELVSNALKHAFPDGRAGVIEVGLTSARGEVTLSVRDDGVGFPDGATVGGTKTFGLRLVAALVDQLHGRLEAERGGGTTVRVTFRGSAEIPT